MGLDRTIGGFIMLGIIANSWRRFLGLFVADAVTFDGTNDYLNATSITGIADSKQGTVSVWVRMADITLPITRILWFGTATSTMGITVTSGSGILSFFLRNSAGTIIWNQDVGTASDYTSDTWYHLCISWDLSTLTTHMYLDDVSNKGQLHNAPVNALADLTTTPYRIGSVYDNSGKFYGDMSELYFTTEYLDISTESNRRKFITADGKPVNLGSDGSTPTGTQPLIYFSGEASVWNAGTNKGSGGDFTMTGSVTDSLNEPVELPNAVDFDGTNDYLTRTSALSLTNTKEFTISFWMYISAGGGKTIFTALDTAGDIATGMFVIENRNTLGDLIIQGRNSANTVILNHVTATNPVITNDTWHHVMASYDLLNGNGSLWINGVQDGTAIAIITNDTLDLTRTFNTIGHFGGGAFSLMNGDLSELYVSNEYIDLSVQANREKFLASDGTPVDLGSDGSTPTGTSPFVYFTGHAGIWNAGTNAGSGGDFTMTGAVTGSSNMPVELP